ncbi:MAG: hypothetical protein RR197_02510, partial [Oscillospiraceae bacterium]
EIGFAPPGWDNLLQRFGDSDEARKRLIDFDAVCLLEPIYENGARVYHSPSLPDIQAFCKAEMDRMWDELKRFENPHRYYVDLSEKLWLMKNELLQKASIK